MGLIQEFKEFAVKGNVVDMAVGIIIGGAFGKIVSSLVADVIMPPIGLILGGVDFSNLKVTLKDAVPATADAKAVEAVTLNYGQFINTTIDFVIIAFSIFIVIKMMNRLQRKAEEQTADAPPPPADVQPLTEIRDLLKTRG